jgi:thiol-disulfide isomerase/thioredoxin
MKHNLLLFATIILSISISAQTNKISLSGKLNTKEKISVLHLYDIDSVSFSIPVTAQNNFSFTSNNLKKGFYTLDEIGTLYLCPGYKMNIQSAKKGTNSFTGIGALENNALYSAREQLSSFLPVSDTNALGELASEDYFMDMPVFLQKLDSFQNSGNEMINKSNDLFFRKYAALDLEFFKKHLLSLYNIYYGLDLKKMETLSQQILKVDFKSPNFIKKIDSINQSMYIKQMPPGDRLKLSKLIYKNWDRNNDTLFQNSYWYREAFDGFFSSMLYNQKYFSYKTFNLNNIKREDNDIRKLAVAKGEISNPYILSYFEHSLTSAILKTAKDTATLNKFYNEYLTKNSRPDYLLNIKEIYNNAVSYKDNMQAPEFSFKNVANKPISLQNLRGKFVYIDVWATWCGPCKAEIPYLKKLEAAYHDKNIEFVSISVDKEQDENKWKKFIKKNELKGIQLISDNAFESSFIKKMSINFIPRFILIDPVGKIIYADALRPSNAELSVQLNKLL